MLKKASVGILAALCLPIYCRELSARSQLAFAVPRQQTKKAMGLFQSKEKVAPSDPDQEEDWRAEMERLEKQCCDPYYHHNVIRKSTLAVAREYGEGTSDFGSLFPGVHKYLGGAADDRDGCIYGIPSHSRSLICLYPTDEGYKIRIEPLPEHIANGQFKWLRGIIAHGYLYGIPSKANCVLEVDIDAMWGRREAKGDIINLIPLPEGHVARQWQWHGASLNKEKTAIYGIPSNAHNVLKVDLVTHSTSFIKIDIPPEYKEFSFDHSNKWYGGILGDDNAVYGIPYRTCSVLRIDTETDTARIVGPDHGCKLFNWHGGTKINGMIYAFPSHAGKVLKIDTSMESKGQNSTLLDIHRDPDDTDTNTNYKWLGGSVGADGNIYAMPADSSSILKIDTTTDHCSSFGFVGTDKNKWQGGVLSHSDGCIYCIPANGRNVLRIDSRAEGNNAVTLLGNLPERKDKWQGAFFGQDGVMYAIPECGYRILKVQPSPERRDWKTGEITDDVRVEMM
jgi:hypothetical protein